MRVGGDFPPSDNAGDNGAEWQDMGETPILENDSSNNDGGVEANQGSDSEQLEGWSDELEAAVQEIFHGRESKHFFSGQIKGLDGGTLSIDSVRDYIRGLDDDEKKKVVRRSKVVYDLYLVDQANLYKAYRAFTGISDGEFNLVEFMKNSSTDDLEAVLKMAQGPESDESPEKAAASEETSGDSGEAASVEPRYEDLDYEELAKRVGSSEWLDADYGGKKTVAEYIRDFNYSKADLERVLHIADCTEEISGLLGLTSLSDTITSEVWNKIIESGLENEYRDFVNFRGSLRLTKIGLDLLKSIAKKLHDAGFPIASGASEPSLEPDKNNPESAKPEAMENSESGAEDQEAKEKASLIEALTPTTKSEIVFVADQLGLDGENATIEDINKALEVSDIAKLSALKSKLEEFRKKPEGSTGEGGRSPEELARREKTLAGLEKYFPGFREYAEQWNIPTEQLELYLRVTEYTYKFAGDYNSLSSSERKQVRAKFSWLAAYKEDLKTLDLGEICKKYSEEQFKEVISYMESIKGGDPGAVGEAGAESREAKEKAQLVKDLMPVDKTQISFVVNKLGLMGADGSLPSLEAIEQALNGMEVGALKDLKSQLEAYGKRAEGNGEANTSPERLETLRKMTFGEWFHEVYGGAKSEKWPEDSFFAAPIEKQREAMARYMDMFDADARLEADRKYMVEELRRSDMMQKTMEEYNKDPDNKIKLSASLTPAELEERFAKLSPDKLNKLYAAVFYGAKKGAGAASSSKPGAGAQPKPGSSAGGGSGSGADGEPHGAPNAETGGGANDEPTAEPDSEKKPTVDELVAEYAPGNMPKTNDELLTRMKDVPDIKLSISRAGGEEAFAVETMKHIQVWSGLPEVTRRSVLEGGTSGLSGDMKALNSVVYLQRVGFLPRTLYGKK